MLTFLFLFRPSGDDKGLEEYFFENTTQKEQISRKVWGGGGLQENYGQLIAKPKANISVGHEKVIHFTHPRIAIQMSQ